MKQREITERNKSAWEADSYCAWVHRYGEPDVAALDIVSNPKHTLRRVIQYIGNPKDLRVANPLGSHGRIATALALLKAEVTVFDVSESNARYARELAANAGTSITYVVGDFLKTAQQKQALFDIAVAELGIVHYFSDLSSFVAGIKTILKPGAKLVLNDFHPILKKSISIESGQASISGDYFTTTCEIAPTPYEIFTDSKIPPCVLRRWNLGEIVTAFCDGDFHINQLVEHPATEFPQLPGTFTLVATST